MRRLEKVVFPDEEGPAISTTRTESRRALIRSAISAILRSCRASATSMKPADAAVADQPVQPADRADAQDLSPALVLPVDGNEHGVLDEGAHGERRLRGRVAQQEAGRERHQREDLQHAGGRHERAVVEVDRAGARGDPHHGLARGPAGAARCRAGRSPRSTPPPRPRRAGRTRWGGRPRRGRACAPGGPPRRRRAPPRRPRTSTGTRGRANGRSPAAGRGTPGGRRARAGSTATGGRR